MAIFTSDVSSTVGWAENFGVDVGDLQFQRLDPADFQSPADPAVSYAGDYIEYVYDESSYDAVWRFGGDFEFDMNGSEVEAVSGTVTQIDYRLTYFVDWDPGVPYWKEFSISGISIDVSAFQTLDDAALTALIFSGDDSIKGTPYSDVLLGFDGADVLQSGRGEDILDGGLGADTTVDGLGDDIHYVEGNADRVIEKAGEGGLDVVRSGSNYVLAAGVAIEWLETRDGTGTAAIDLTGNELDQNVRGNEGVNRLEGAGGKDFLHGEGGGDLLYGGIGNDLLKGGSGADYLNGGTGADTAYYESASAGVVVHLLAPANNQGEAAGDTFVSIEYIHGSRFDDELAGTAGVNRLEGDYGADDLFGLDGDDKLYGGFGDDHLEGGEGSDTLLGENGADHLDGGAGWDTVSYETAGLVVVDLQTPANNQGHATGDTFNSIEKIIGASGNDRLSGDAGANTFAGGYGADRLFGRDGNDTLEGSGGIFDGDYLSGGAGLDTASYEAATGRVVVQLLTPENNEGEASGDTYNSIENIVGGNFDDGLVGTTGGNRLDGGQGADRIFGIDGNDTVVGGEGADYLSGGLGTDTASYASATARVIVSLANTAINTGDAAGDTFNSVENLLGSAFDDYVYGNNAVNVIKGGAGNDIIKGYGGNDTLAGGSGQDIFVFNTALDPATNVDTVTDFNVTADTIWLDDLFFAALSTGPLAAAAFRTNATGQGEDTDDRIVYNTSTGELSYDSDGNGAGGSVLFAKLTAGLALTSADFVVI